MDKICPDCRNPVVSLMIIDAAKGPEHHCERCARAVTPVEKAAPGGRPASAARRLAPVLN